MTKHTLNQDDLRVKLNAIGKSDEAIGHEHCHPMAAFAVARRMLREHSEAVRVDALNEETGEILAQY